MDSWSAWRRTCLAPAAAAPHALSPSRRPVPAASAPLTNRCRAVRSHISKPGPRANPTPTPTREAMRSSVIPALPTCPHHALPCSGLPMLSSTITRCGPRSTAPLPRPPVPSPSPSGWRRRRRPRARVALHVQLGAQRLFELLWRGENQPPQPQASNISSCRLCGSHTIHDHTSGLRVTTISLTSRGAVEHRQRAQHRSHQRHAAGPGPRRRS